MTALAAGWFVQGVATETELLEALGASTVDEKHLERLGWS
jgi:hypothetical protein